MNIRYQSPVSKREWQAYFELRWQILRAPWHQPRGSERDDQEAMAYHVMAVAKNDEVVGCGRLHKIDERSAQLRYMAVAAPLQGKGIGQTILAMLEIRAIKWQCQEVILNARTSALDFYLAHNYQISAEAPLLFGCIAHKRMQKQLCASDQGKSHIS